MYAPLMQAIPFRYIQIKSNSFKMYEFWSSVDKESYD